LNGPVYADLQFPLAHAGRPYVFVNMVTTIDGKSVSGERMEPVADLGSDLDHETMRLIEEAADAVMIGAGSLRATAGLHYPSRLARFVVSSTGRLDYGAPFFTATDAKGWVVTNEAGEKEVAGRAHCLVTGPGDVRLEEALRRMRVEMGVERLLVEGGSELNASLLRLDLVDELFLTMSPLIKLGRHTPTYADGEPLPREGMLRFALVSAQPRGDEVFLRYRRSP
jgi:riboflavin biosynthesis pyrimidine reductase